MHIERYGEGSYIIKELLPVDGNEEYRFLGIDVPTGDVPTGNDGSCGFWLEVGYRGGASNTVGITFAQAAEFLLED